MLLIRWELFWIFYFSIHFVSFLSFDVEDCLIIVMALANRFVFFSFLFTHSFILSTHQSEVLVVCCEPLACVASDLFCCARLWSKSIVRWLRWEGYLTTQWGKCIAMSFYRSFFFSFVSSSAINSLDYLVMLYSIQLIFSRWYYALLPDISEVDMSQSELKREIDECSKMWPHTLQL